MIRCLDDLEIYDVIQNIIKDPEIPRTEIEEHIEVCEKCQRRISDMETFFYYQMSLK